MIKINLYGDAQVQAWVAEHRVRDQSVVCYLYIFIDRIPKIDKSLTCVAKARTE